MFMENTSSCWSRPESLLLCSSHSNQWKQLLCTALFVFHFGQGQMGNQTSNLLTERGALFHLRQIRPSWLILIIPWAVSILPSSSHLIFSPKCWNFQSELWKLCIVLKRVLDDQDDQEPHVGPAVFWKDLKPPSDQSAFSPWNMSWNSLQVGCVEKQLHPLEGRSTTSEGFLMSYWSVIHFPLFMFAFISDKWGTFYVELPGLIYIFIFIMKWKKNKLICVENSDFLNISVCVCNTTTGRFNSGWNIIGFSRVNLTVDNDLTSQREADWLSFIFYFIGQNDSSGADSKCNNKEWEILISSTVLQAVLFFLFMFEHLCKRVTTSCFW